MKPQTVQLVSEAIDQAISATLGERYHRIMTDALGKAFADQTRASIAEERSMVTEAVSSLHGNLRRLQPPDYDNPLVPLFYGAWFQPFQINLIYSLMMEICDHDRDRITSEKPLHIVDFGCGALATHFALLMALVDMIEQGRPTPKVRIDGIDTSMHMMGTGTGIMRLAVQTLKDKQVIPSGGLGITMQFPGNTTQIHSEPGEECWLTAFHTFYRRYQVQVRRGLTRIAGRLNPTVGLMTGYVNNREVIDFTSPFGNRGDFYDIPELRLDGILPDTTDWRQAKAALLYDSSNWKDLMQSSSVGWIRPRYEDTIVYLYGVREGFRTHDAGLDVDDLPF